MFIDWINFTIKEIETQIQEVKNIAIAVEQNFLLSDYTKENIKKHLFDYTYDNKIRFLNTLLEYKEKIDNKIYFHQTPVKVIRMESDNIHKNINSLVNIKSFLNESTLFTFTKEDSFNRNCIYIFSSPINSQEMKCIQFAISNFSNYHEESSYYSIEAFEWTGEDLVSVDINNGCTSVDIIELKKD